MPKNKLKGGSPIPELISLGAFTTCFFISYLFNGYEIPEGITLSKEAINDGLELDTTGCCCDVVYKAPHRDGEDEQLLVVEGEARTGGGKGKGEGKGEEAGKKGVPFRIFAKNNETILNRLIEEKNIDGKLEGLKQDIFYQNLPVIFLLNSENPYIYESEKKKDEKDYPLFDSNSKTIYLKGNIRELVQ